MDGRGRGLTATVILILPRDIDLVVEDVRTRGCFCSRGDRGEDPLHTQSLSLSPSHVHM